MEISSEATDVNTQHEGAIRLLRHSNGKPVWGVRLQIRCGCGYSYAQTFVIDVERPFTTRCNTGDTETLPGASP